MELSCLKIKKFLIFSRKKFFLYFGKWNFSVLASNFSRKKISYFFPKKTTKTHSEKISYIFSKRLFLIF